MRSEYAFAKPLVVINDSVMAKPEKSYVHESMDSDYFQNYIPDNPSKKVYHKNNRRLRFITVLNDT